ncbi:hypothetical protein MSEO_16310 [Mycobacterium seoulense]|uniref:Uncharacterized protein n=1 Tax=Mycobacterium seoulense TaxID=386911 RepID=A0A7I7NZ92_9MYCO|nr:hypothetical protein MSEO_16310 [Mycobacterium seoulense]
MAHPLWSRSALELQCGQAHPLSNAGRWTQHIRWDSKLRESTQIVHRAIVRALVVPAGMSSRAQSATGRRGGDARQKPENASQFKGFLGQQKRMVRIPPAPVLENVSVKRRLKQVRPDTNCR